MMPPKCLKVWLYYTHVASDKNKCKKGGIISDKTGNKSDAIKLLIIDGGGKKEVLYWYRHYFKLLALVLVL